MIDFVSKQISEMTTVVSVSGRMTESNRKYFFECVQDIIESGVRHVVIDCDRLGYLDSSSLAGLLRARKRAIKRGSRISLAHLNSNVAEVLELTKLGRILSIYPTTNAAIANVNGEPMCVT